MPEEAASTKVRMRVQDHNTRVVYANAFRHNSTPHEVILDLGINTVTGRPTPSNEENDATAEMLFQVDTRLVLNYATAQRLNNLLAQVVQQHEQRQRAVVAAQARPEASETQATTEEQAQLSVSTT